MAKIQYVGRKPREIDSKAGTGVVWNGHGDIQEVPGWAVQKLIRYADVWRLVDEPGNAAEIAESAQAHAAENMIEQGASMWRHELTLRMNEMDKNELERLGLEKFNVNLDKRKSLANLRAELNAMIDRFGLPE